jgi:hypothetical protein
MEVMLANRSDARDRAEAQFDKTQKPKDVGEKALSEYEKEGQVVRAKTALDAEARDKPNTGGAKLL